jgi:hypothetical protein
VIPCGIGLFITAPISVATLMYAYEDILGVAGRAASRPIAVGPSGTEVLPGNLGRANTGGGFGRGAALVGSALVLVLILVTVVSLFRARRLKAWQEAEAAQAQSPEPDSAAAVPVGFGHVIERVLTIGTDIDFLDLDTGKVLHHPAGASPDAVDSKSELIAWVRETGSDVGFVTNSATGTAELIGFDMGTFSFGKETVSDNDRPEVGALSAVTNIWNDLQADQLYYSSLAEKPQTAWFPSNIVSFPTVFETREGAVGLLQAVADSDNPSILKIRYKLAIPTPGTSGTVSAEKRKRLRQTTLAERMDAATAISGNEDKDRSLAAVARDAAAAGEPELARQALGRIAGSETRDRSAYESAIALAKRGLKKPAIEIAKTIGSTETRDRTLSELAR